MPHATPEIQLDAVRRRLELIWEGGSVAATQSLSRRIDAPVDETWQALTEPGRLAQWFAPVRLHDDGSFAVEGNASGSVTECSPSERYALSWEFGDQTSDVVVEVVPEDGATRVRLLHAAEISEQMWGDYGPGVGGVGWDLALLGLYRHVTEGTASPLETTEWIHSQEARDFIAGSSRRWADASIEAGTPIEQARRAAESTRAFYLGESGGA